MNIAKSQTRHWFGVAFAWALIVVCLVLPFAVTPSDAADSGLRMQVVAVEPDRVHLLKAGESTTFVLGLQNVSAAPLSVSLAIESAFTDQVGWSSSLAPTDEQYRPTAHGVPQLSVTIQPQQVVGVLAILSAPLNGGNGQAGRAVVTASTSGTPVATAEVRARIRNVPKIYFVALDSCGAGYLYLDRKGNRYTGTGERLMPEAAAFFEEAALLSDARAHLPAATDMNHAAALTGSWPGTLGVPYINFYYGGFDSALNQAVTVPVSNDLLRWGATGEPIETIFDVMKHDSNVGDPDVFSAIFSGKEWINRLFEDGAGTVDILAGGRVRPAYVREPWPYRIGDPPSDPDAALDRDGTNLSPANYRKMVPNAQARVMGTNPRAFPSDRWIAEGAIKMLYAEDPDVFYVHMAECDNVQHYFGAADRPEEWRDPGTPNAPWDDTNRYNPSANRGVILDVVYEADFSFGLFLDELRRKETFDDSIVVLLADHSATTLLGESFLDLGRILLDAGVAQADVEYIQTVGDMAWIHLTDAAKSRMVETALQNYQAYHPVLKTTLKPLMVISREEMDSGIDDVIGPFAGDGIAGNRRGEMYSEWNIDHPVSDYSKVRWGDLFVMARERFQFIAVGTHDLTDNDWLPWPGGPLLGAHNLPGTTWVPLAIHGPGVQPGVYPERVSLVDIAPTLYELLDAQSPPHVDGRVIETVLEP